MAQKKKAPLGSGARFAALKKELTGKKGVRDPGALAASIGRKKLGKKKMASLSAAGRKRKSSAPFGGKKAPPFKKKGAKR